MDEQDKQVAKDSLDTLVSAVPGLNIAWGLSKAIYGAGLKLRHARALEWVEMVRENPTIFTRAILEHEDFQDGFVYALEKFITERQEKKRNHYKNIFLNFARSENRTKYELEKFFFVLSQLLDEDIYLLRYVDLNTPNSYQIFDDTKYRENIYNLINVGILNVDPSSRMGPIHSPHVYTTDFGRRFIYNLLNS